MGHSQTTARQAWRGGRGLAPLTAPTPFAFHPPTRGHACLETPSRQGTCLNKLHTENVYNGARRELGCVLCPLQTRGADRAEDKKACRGTHGALGRRSTRSRPPPRFQSCTCGPCFYSSLRPLLPWTCVNLKLLVHSHTNELRNPLPAKLSCLRAGTAGGLPSPPSPCASAGARSRIARDSPT